jgi:hypothetical protein
MGYCVRDWARDFDGRKNTTGFVFFMGGMALHGPQRSNQLLHSLLVSRSMLP